MKRNKIKGHRGKISLSKMEQLIKSGGAVVESDERSIVSIGHIFYLLNPNSGKYIMFKGGHARRGYSKVNKSV